jgi:hypothetical protein
VTSAVATELLYLYAVAPSGTALVDEPILGIGGAAVRAIEEGGLAAFVDDVPARDFDEEPLNAHLADLEWLAPRAERHQLVNARLFERADALLPLSFGTVFRSEDSVRRMLRERRADLLARLETVRGCSEWVVTVRRDTPRAEAALEARDESLARLRRDLAVSRPGRRYLLERQAGEVRQRALRSSDAATAAEVGEAVERAARRVFREPIIPGAAETGQAVARLSALVERTAESQFCDHMDALAARWLERGYALERTGPWPPYRFGAAS